MPGRALGAAITGRFAVSGGEAQVHQGGAAFYGQVGAVTVLFAFPMLGVPRIAPGVPGAAEALEPSAIGFQIGGYPLDVFVATLKEIFAARMGLVPTGRAPAAAVQMQLGAPSVIERAASGVQATHGVPVVAALQDRTLYDIAVRADDGVWHPVAPHAIYYRASWHDFGIAHITDIHLARRIDFFAGRLRSAGKVDAANRLINFNDRFRGFIRYANFLHDQGLLDVILATGDIIDYNYEVDDEPSGGNALFARRLILGQLPSETFPDVEELRVPMFMVPGNHDYRRNPYHVMAELILPQPSLTDLDYIFRSRIIEWFGPKVPLDQYAQYGLDSPDEAIIAQAHDATISLDDAARALDIDYDLTTYKRHLADELNYVIRLGSHRVVMLDSGHDTELPTSKLEAVMYKVLRWLGDENVTVIREGKGTAIDGSPNSLGVTERWFGRVVDNLAETPAGSLFIVGIHAPLFNMWKEEYPYFFRESQRQAHGDQAIGWLVRSGQAAMMPKAAVPKWVREQHRSFFAPDGGTPSYVKRGDPNELLDYGVSRGAAHSLLRAVTGIDQRRKADVILQGHVHRFNEFRLEDVDGDVAYFTDFYTQNLSRYYPCRFTTGWVELQLPVNDFNLIRSLPALDVTYVEFAADAPAGNQPSEMPVKAEWKYVVSAPTNPTPLSSAPDHRAWWAKHSPLVLQTEALGPFKDETANLGGFRLMTVKDDVIERIDWASIEKLHAANYRIEWTDLIRLEPPRRFTHAQRSREFGSPAIAGSPCGYAFPARRSQTIIYRGSEGQLFELWRDGQGERGDGDLIRAASGAPRAAGDPSCYMDDGLGMIVVPYRGVDGHVHTIHWTPGEIGHDPLSAEVDAPPAIGRPVGFYNRATTQHLVIYLSSGGQLWSLSWKGQERAVAENLTSGASALPAKGDPAPYLDSRRNVKIVVYRASDDRIRNIYWSEEASKIEDLSGVAGSPPAAGDPCAYYIPNQDLNQVYYRGHDQHVHELVWKGTDPVAGWNLTAATGAPRAAGDPFGWHNTLANKKHVVYAGVDGHLHDITWTPGGPVAHVNLSEESWGTRPSGRPFGFSGTTHQYVVYPGTDNQVHEIRWEEGGTGDSRVLSMRATVRDCLNIGGAISAKRDILSIHPGPAPRSLREALNVIRGT